MRCTAPGSAADLQLGWAAWTELREPLADRLSNQAVYGRRDRGNSAASDKLCERVTCLHGPCPNPGRGIGAPPSVDIPSPIPA